GHAGHLAARRFERLDLRHRRLDVLGVRVAHRLDDHRRVPAHRNVADPDLPRLASLDHRHLCYSLAAPAGARLARRAATASTSASRVEAPAVSPTRATPANQAGSSSSTVSM